MYYILALLTGAFISSLIVMNGGLAATYGLYSSMVILHFIGLLPILFLVWYKNETPFSSKYPLPLYFGGACNALVILLASYAYRHLSVSAILALGLLGQSVAGTLLDQFGFFQVPKYPITRNKILSLILLLAGALLMMDGFVLRPVLLAFTGGILFVISRTLNARFATLTNTTLCTFYHYGIGLILSILAFLFFGASEISYPEFGMTPFSPNWYIYFGGIVGILVIFLGNLTVLKISALSLTLLIFIGQVTTGMSLDLVRMQEPPSPGLFIGVIFITFGLLANLFLGRTKMAK